MTEQTANRKLTTIFYADVAGYSRLTGEDELGTHERVMAVLDTASAEIGTHGGTVLRYAGDAILAEFPSVVSAVEAALDIQTAIRDFNELNADSRRVEIRIGIHLGEVLLDRDEIFGDGVNIAARLEAEAQPGGVCISAIVHEQVQGKIEAEFVSQGTRELKNIARPVEIFFWNPEAGPDTIEKDLALPSKPSIAILAFENMSNDPEQDFFAEGISEDIITLLSKFRSFFVIARNSSFAFKGQATDVKEISRKLGVRYVVEGSVRRAGNKVRITAQLIDAVEDKHLWAERYDRDLEDIFAVQDEVTQAIVATLEPQLQNVEMQLARRKPTDSLNAWECFQRGLWHLYQYDGDNTLVAMELLEKATALDPEFASAHGGLAFCYYVRLLMSDSIDREGDMEKGLQAGITAVRLDESDPFAHVGRGRMHIIRGEHEEAISVFDRAIELNPSLATAHLGRAHSLWHCGHPDQAVLSHDEAIRLSPRDPLMWVFLASKAIALVMLERYDEALEHSRKAQKYPITAIWAYMGELSALGHLRREDEAAEALARALERKPDLTMGFIRQSLPVDHGPTGDHFFNGLALAGVPE